MNKNMKVGKAKKGTFRRLLSLVFKENKLKIVFVLIFMLISTAANVGAMLLVQKVLKEAVILFEMGGTDFTKVIINISLMAGLYIANIIFTYSHLRIMVSVGQGTLTHIRTSLFKHMIDLPLSYFDTNKHGDLMSRFTNDVDATRQMISQSLPQLIISTLMIIGYFTAMVITSWMLSIVSLLFTITLLFITRKLASSTRKYFIAQQQNVGELNGYIEEMIEGQKVVKVFRHEKESIEQFAVLNKKVKDTANISTRRSGMLIPITVNAGYLGFSVVAILGGILVFNGLMEVHSLAGYLLLSRLFTGPLNQMGQQLNFVQMALAGASRVFDVMDQEKEIDEGDVVLVNTTYDDNNNLIETNNITNTWAWKDGKELINLAGDVRFHDVDFGYIDDKLVLKDISLFAKPGQKIAFVGATGAGKTTITNLINRFYDVKKGSITIDGIDVKRIKKSSLRNSLAMVLQDTNLFTDTVFENIRYGNLNASNEDIINAAKLANAHEFILKLPKGYNTIIEDNGNNLSQGQRQLLSIARAAISNPPILILDEATSSIDTYTERLIQKGMDKLMEGKTVFVIAHRLSTIKNAKAIILLDEGKIIERGRHTDLIRERGVYYQLYTGAFELE